MVRGEFDGPSCLRFAPQVSDSGDVVQKLLSVLMLSQRDLEARCVAVLDDGYLSVSGADVEAAGDVHQPTLGRVEIFGSQTRRAVEDVHQVIRGGATTYKSETMSAYIKPLVF